MESFRLLLCVILSVTVSGCFTGSIVEVESENTPPADGEAPREVATPDVERLETAPTPPPTDPDPNAPHDFRNVDGMELLPTTKRAEYDFIAQEYQQSRNLTTDGLFSYYDTTPGGELDYSPTNAQNLDLIQNSELALGDEALATLESNGFVISRGHSFPNFFSGYESIYAEDLPIYVSADSIMDAVHRSYDSILESIEVYFIVGDLETILESMDAALGTQPMEPQTRVDLDIYISVARSLLADELVPPSHGGDAEIVAALVAGAKAAEGMSAIDLFGVSRDVDFSQFKPRGHYENHYVLSAYFRAMMWLGRIDFRLVETAPDGSQSVNRPQIAATIEMGNLLEGEMDLWVRVNRALELFVGKSDNMMPSQIPDLLTALGINDASDLAGLSDDAIATAILMSGLGAQQISSHIMMNGMGSGTLPLNASYLLFGQRYVVDSHVFSNLVYSRVMEGNVMRMMPDPLDAAFAALQNDQAARLLEPELAEYGYAPDLHMMRHMVEGYEDSFWHESLYNLWLRALQTLSPMNDPGLPSIAGTANWGRRMINTQLGSWSQLRHDTLLYAKQSYTDGVLCEFPDAYVEPYPAFYDALVEYADKGQEVVALFAADGSPIVLNRMGSYFTEMAFVAEILGEMAEAQRAGIPFTTAQMAFINDMVYQQMEFGCGMPPTPKGWYVRLFYNMYDAQEHDPVIADVHTQVTDEMGAMVGNVLHVATGNPRLMVVTVNNCSGPRAYVGLVFAYHELIKGGFTRMTDSEWVTEMYTSPPTDEPWLQDLIAF